MPINFPNNPSNGTTHTVSGTTWTYNSAKTAWDITSSTATSIGIDDLTDVDITTAAPTDGQVLVWNTSNTEFEPGTITSYSTSDFNTDLATKDTDDVSEGSTNVYYTDARVQTKLGAISGNVIPATNVAYDLGSAAYAFKDLYLSGSTISLGSLQISDNSGSLSVTASGSTEDFATQTYVNTQVSNLVDSAPATLDTLNELASALGDDANFSTTVTNSIATKLPLSGGAMTGAITTNSTFDGRDVATDGTKLDTIETNADVTDATNVQAAGALMDSEVTNLAEVKAFSSSDYATSTQGTTADNALPKSGGTMTGDIDGSGNKVLFANMYATEGDLPSATTYHGMFAHVHATGKGYFAHGGNWIKILDTNSSIDDISNVDITTSAPTDGQALVWNNSGSKFVPGDVSSGGITYYANVSSLPSSGTNGDTAYVAGDNRLYIFNTNNWDSVEFDSPSYSIALSSTAINEGGTLTVTVTTANVPGEPTLYWDTDTPAEFSVSSGSFNISGTTGSFTLTPISDGVDEPEKTFTVRIRTGSTSGTIVATSSAITLNDPSVWSQEALLLPASADPLDKIGERVAISGDTVILGAPLDDDTATDSGAAYIYTRSGTTWTLEQKLKASDAQANDGDNTTAFAISGDTAVIGLQDEDTTALSAGSIYVFTRSGTTWTEQQKIQASDAAENDRFGVSVGIDGDTIVVGANYEDDTYSNAGSVYVFTRSGTTWTQQQKIQPSDVAAFDEFGYSVAISGDTIIAGSVWDDDTNSGSGSAYIFTRSGTTWTQQQKLTASVSEASARFGTAVTIDGDSAAVGVPFENVSSVSDSGAVYIFTRSGTTWSEQQRIPHPSPGANDHFGKSIDIDSNNIIIGAENIDSPSSNSGKAYIYKRGGSTWNLYSTLQGSNTDENDGFGSGVGIEGESAVIGSRLGETGSGSGSGFAHIFTLRKTYSVTPASSSINEGAALTVNVSTGNVANSSTLYYTLTNSGDFTTSSGSFTINNDAGSFTVTPTADATTEGSETFQIEIRTDSISGTIVATSSTITINDTSITPPPFVTGGDKAIIAHGRGTTGSGAEFFQSRDVKQISTTGNASFFGNLGFGKYANGLAAVSNGTRIVFAGGRGGSSSGVDYSQSPSGQINYSSMDYYASVSLASASNFGNLTAGKSKLAGAGNGTYGLFAGGGAYSSYSISSWFADIERITVSTTGNASYFSTLPAIRAWVTGAADSTRALFFGGVNSGYTAFNEIRYQNFTTSGINGDFGDLTIANQKAAATADSTRAVIFGGQPAGNSNHIDYVTIQTTGNATDFGDLVYITSEAGASSDGTYALCTGGSISNLFGEEMQRVTVQTTGNASYIGDLTKSAMSAAASGT